MTLATQPKATVIDRSEANMALVRRALTLALTEAGDADLTALYAPEFRYLQPQLKLDGVRGARRICENYFAGISDAEFDVIGMDASGDRVTTRIRLRGRHAGYFEGHAPTGRSMEAQGLLVHRIEGGRIAEAWGVLRWS